ncbi:VCBS repeat-containing protein [Bradymonadaceae bacterium TMQ3]|nr:VCBS repeat-containing protein [Bradymonadaceae bacterium TMQ3]TXC74572.1 VCBS repeat-containing protein [Bradymonadales bacterium TMQ1]
MVRQGQGVWLVLMVMVVLGAGCGDSVEELEQLDAGGDAWDGGEDANAEDVGGRDVEPCLDGEEQVCDLSESCRGIQMCVEGEWAACEAPDEICDGVDNDCDGEIDEDFAGLGEVCVSGEGQCEVSGEMICGDDGQSVTCSVEAGPGVEEVCDGVDNDCDGEVDNVVGLGESCSVGTGQCAASGVQVCDVEARTLVCDALSAEPGEEVCDGVDNDCDGEVDNVVGLGESCSVGTGQCAASGTRVCDIDAGALVCNASAGGPQSETCNGLDDDCDGVVDNVPGLGESCSVGTGQCAASGTRVCDVDAGALVCNAVEGSPSAEVCDGRDNNCNGTVDDVPGLGTSCSVGTGQCAASGTRICDIDAGALVCNAVEGSPSAEVCDGRDNNCNGTVDDVPGLGTSCSVGTGQCAASGTRVCNTNTGTLACSAVAGSPSAEVCDGRDNNCNGTVDDVPGLGTSCSVGTGQCAASGTRVCDVGARALVCNATAGSPQTETCNGVDDNCDGTPDNVSGLGNSCSVGVGACRRTGSRICDLGSESLTCSASPGHPSAETCNGVDDNCDGTIDNTTMSFGVATTYGADRGCIAMAAGDINGDGRIDVVCAPVIHDANNLDTRLFTYLNQGGGNFASATYLQAVAVSPFRTQSDVALGDVDGDGDLDIVAVGETMKAQVYINNGSGQFAAPYEAFQFSPGGEPGTGGLVLDDMDGDGDLDIVTTIGSIRSSDWSLALSPNNGSGTFGAPTIIDATVPRARALRSFNPDGDGDRDLVAIYPTKVSLYRAASPGTFNSPNTVVNGTVSLGADPVLADLNNDGRADLLLPATGMRYFVPGTASGFGSAQSSTRPATEVSAAVGQFDCDGSAEAMIVAVNGGAPLYYLAHPQNLSSEGVAAGLHGTSVRVFDVDRDGDDDVVVGAHANGIRVLRRH